MKHRPRYLWHESIDNFDTILLQLWIFSLGMTLYKAADFRRSQHEVSPLKFGVIISASYALGVKFPHIGHRNSSPAQLPHFHPSPSVSAPQHISTYRKTISTMILKIIAISVRCKAWFLVNFHWAFTTIHNPQSYWWAS